MMGLMLVATTSLGEDLLLYRYPPILRDKLSNGK